MIFALSNSAFSKEISIQIDKDLIYHQELQPTPENKQSQTLTNYEGFKFKVFYNSYSLYWQSRSHQNNLKIGKRMSENFELGLILGYDARTNFDYRDKTAGLFFLHYTNFSNSSLETSLDLTASNKSVKSNTPKNENSKRHTLGIDYIYNLNETLKGAVGASIISQIGGENGDYTALQLRILSLRFTF